MDDDIWDHYKTFPIFSTKNIIFAIFLFRYFFKLTWPIFLILVLNFIEATVADESSVGHRQVRTLYHYRLLYLHHLEHKIKHFRFSNCSRSSKATIAALVDKNRWFDLIKSQAGQYKTHTQIFISQKDALLCL